MDKSENKRSFRSLRIIYNKTIYQMSAILGISIEQIIRWETREEKCPRYIIDLIKTKIDNDL